MRKPVAWLVALAFVAAGCGTTVAQSRLVVTPGASVRGGALSDEGTGGAVTSDGERTNVGGGSGASSPSAGSASADGFGDSANPTIPPGGPVAGASGGKIVLGYSTSKDLSSVGGAVGVAGTDTGDVTAQMTALAAYVNSHGGVLGHTIQLADYDVNAMQASDDPSTTAEAACTAWTEDDHVFAVLDTYGIAIGAQSNTLQDCLAKHATPLFAATGDGDGTPRTFGLPYGPFSPDGMRQGRYMAALVGRLVADQFFTGWNTAAGGPGQAPVKVGLMHFDDPQWDAYAAGIKSALAAHGMRVADEASWSDGVQNASSGASAAVLRFRSDGITHVFGANVVFYHAAESQGYYPRYAVDDTIDSVSLLAQQPGIAKELHGAMGSGSLPGAEVPNPPDPTPAATLCMQIMDIGGQRYWRSNSLALIVMESECDDVFLLVAAVQRAGVVSPAGVLNGVNSLGSAFVPAMTYRTAFGPTIHDGAAAVRDYRYDDQCGCFTFLSSEVYPT